MNQDERIERWKAERAEEGELRNVHRQVYDDMLTALHAKAFSRVAELQRMEILAVVEAAVRLAYCCTLGGEKGPAIISSHQQKFCEAFRDTIGVHRNGDKKTAGSIRVNPIASL